VGRRICGRVVICQFPRVLLCTILETGTNLTWWSSYYPNPPKISHEVIVEDISGREKDFTLGKNGFMLAKQTSKSMVTTEDLGNTDKIKNEYYPEMQAWLKEV
jgi:hypothetical protein